MSIPKTMKALVARGIHDYALEEIPVPTLQEGDILLKVEACGICAGDIKATHGTARFWGGDGMPAFVKPPFVPGHEFIGRIAAMGENPPEGFAVGDRIVSEQIVPCGTCYYCKRGMYWLCEPHDVYGFKSYLNGGMAEYVRLPKGSLNFHVPEDMPVKEAILIEPFACSFHGVERSYATADDIVVLAGAGTLGLGMVNALRIRGVKKLIVLDLVDQRLEKAKELGADLVFNPNKTDVVREIMALTDGVGCDCYIEATGNPDAVQQGLDIIRKGGNFVEFSVMNGPSSVDWSLVGDAKEINIYGSQLSPNCFPKVIDAMKKGEIRSEGVVSHVFKLDDWQEAFRVAQNMEGFKVIFTMD